MMKRIIRSSIVLAAVTLGTGALAANFGSTNLVIYRIGGDANGSTSGTLTNRGNIVWLDEFYTNGTFFQSHMMPTNYYGANSPLIGSGTAFGSGLISLSADGRFILVNGYGATLGQITNIALGSTSPTQAPRVVGLVDGNDNKDTTTTQTNSLSNNEEMRSSASTDGTNLWFAGDGNGGGGVRYTQRGSGVATNLSTFLTNIRQLNIFSNQLYLSSASGNARIALVTNSAATPPPTTTNDVFIGNLAGVSTTNIAGPWAFVLLKLKAGGADDLDTLYVADATAGGVLKFSLVGATWVNNGSIETVGPVGLTGRTRIVGSTTNVDLWIVGNIGTLTGGDKLYAVTDDTGYNGSPTITAFVANYTTPPSVSFRGIALAPVGGESFPVGPGRLSVGPLLGLFDGGLTGCSVASTQIYSVANFGTAAITWSATSDVNWVSLSPASGSLGSGASITVSAFFNGNVTSLPTGTNTATMTFTNTTSSPNDLGTTTREVRLIQGDRTVTPSSDFITGTASGGTGYTLSNKVYTVNNGSTPITLTVSKTATWLDLSATSVAMGGCTETNITVSLNTANANPLADGFYSDVISFSNATAGTLIDTRGVTLSKGFVYWSDDFSTFNSGDLVGQNGWLQLGANANNPLQISGGALVFPGGQTAAGQAAIKNFPLVTNPVTFAGMLMKITSAVTNGISGAGSITGPSYITAMYQYNNGSINSSFADERFTAKALDTGSGGANGQGSNYVLGTRTTGQGGAPWIFGSQAFATGQVVRVIQMNDVNGTNTTLWVNPSSSTFGVDTPYAVAIGGTNAITFTAAPGVGSMGPSQFGSVAIPSDGAVFYKMAVSTNWATVFNFLGGVAPSDPFTTWQSFYFGCTGCSQAQSGADPDGDGMSNTNEFLAGFNPTNSSARLKITNVVRTDGTNVTITYLGASGDSNGSLGPKTNVLEVTTGTPPSYSNNFVSAGQTNVLTGGTGLGQVATFVHTNGATGPARYYRVRVLVP